jgi:hypothetical protein
VVALDVENRDFGGAQPVKLHREKRRSAGAAGASVEQIPRDQQRRDPFGQRHIDDPRKGGPRRGLHHRAQVFIPQRKRAQRRVEVNIGGVQYPDHGC